MIKSTAYKLTTTTTTTNFEVSSPNFLDFTQTYSPIRLFQLITMGNEVEQLMEMGFPRNRA